MNKKLIHFALAAIGVVMLAQESKAASASEEYDLDERCGKQGEEWWQRQYVSIGRVNSIVLTHYENHYSLRLNKCYFMLTSEYQPDGGRKSVVRSLFDFDDQKEMANYSGMDPGYTRECRVLNKKCSSKAEWDQLIRPYWED